MFARPCQSAMAAAIYLASESYLSAQPNSPKTRDVDSSTRYGQFRQGSATPGPVLGPLIIQPHRSQEAATAARKELHSKEKKKFLGLL